MKKLKLNILKFNLFKKYNYNINEIIGVKEKEKYILYPDKKLIRLYHGKLASKALLSTYIPIEKAIFYSFEIEKSIIEKVDIDSFIETKVYEEGGVSQTEEYEIKYKIIELDDDKNVSIEIVIVPKSYLRKAFKYIIDETGYIDYISFPAFAYESLYEEKILKKANDLFVVILKDKVFLTFYSEGSLVNIVTIAGGLDSIFEELKKLKIKNFDFEIFKKVLLKKGLNETKYLNKEKIILEKLQEKFIQFGDIINNQISSTVEKYKFDSIERIFITTEFGNIPNLEKFTENLLSIKTFNFEFYENYNLDRLEINPFLFLAMLETYCSYKNNNQEYNFSLFLRKPTFFYRPSGTLLLVFISSIILFGAYPLYLYITGLILKEKNNLLLKEISKIEKTNNELLNQINTLTKKENDILKYIQIIKKEIKQNKDIIADVYKFKYSYIPKSSQIRDIVDLMNKNNIYLNKFFYKNSLFTLEIFAFKENNIPNFINSLVKEGFNVKFDKILFKNNKYTTIIRIKE